MAKRRSSSPFTAAHTKRLRKAVSALSRAAKALRSCSSSKATKRAAGRKLVRGRRR